jgi:Flp pilus assembly protein TadB
MSLHSEREPRPPERASLEARDIGSARGVRRRRSALRRLDMLIGLVVAVVWLLLAPGVAMAGIVAVLVLLIAGASALVARRRARRARVRPARRRG